MKCGNIRIPCGKDDAVYLGARAIFDTYGRVELCSKLLFECSCNTAESGNCVLWGFWLPKTMLKPRTAAFMLDMAQMHKARGWQHAVSALQSGLGLASSGLVVDARGGKDKKTKRQPITAVKDPDLESPPPAF